MAMTDFYNDLHDLNQIDWHIMRSMYWHDTEDDPDRKRRRQAEFLVYGFVPIHLLVAVAVKSSEWESKVKQIVLPYGYEGSVVIRPDWYF